MSGPRHGSCPFLWQGSLHTHPHRNPPSTAHTIPIPPFSAGEQLPDPVAGSGQMEEEEEPSPLPPSHSYHLFISCDNDASDGAARRIDSVCALLPTTCTIEAPSNSRLVPILVWRLMTFLTEHERKH